MASVDELKNAYLFHDLPREDLYAMLSVAEERHFEPGQYVYRTGSHGDNFYVIAQGKIELILEKPNNMIYIAGHIGQGGHFGEGALLTGKQRSISVRTLTKTRLLVFHHKHFSEVLLTNRQFHRNLDKALVERLSIASLGEHEFDLRGQTPDAALFPTSHPTPHKQTSGQASGTKIRLDDNLELAKNINKKIQEFAARIKPVFITGESGTGRRLAAKQIHLCSDQAFDPLIELDLRQLDPWIWEGKLFGYQKDTFPFSSGRQLGIFEQLSCGTVVLHHAELLATSLQEKIAALLESGVFTPVDSRIEQPFRGRIIFISEKDLATLHKEGVFCQALIDQLQKHHFVLPPLRQHKRDIPTLVKYYLRQHNAEQNKSVESIDSDALGILMKYDWPGNLTELSNVISRAVMLTQKDQIISEQILLGLPRTEGKLVFNLLRIPSIRKVIESKYFLTVPKIIVAVLFIFGMGALFFGPQEAEKNIGITLSWYIGWPLLIISFFFLPRFWCSICALSAPGKLLQGVLRPTRRIPAFLTMHSRWIMALLCLIVFWVEIVWNAYDSPRLTGAILLAIASGALLFSIFFERFSWCRYFCPLGALNAIFSMPSILEVRANRQMCENQCQDHACYLGTADSPGCPMFRHPFLVDNNKDCILCGRCIKNCHLHSTQLNLRLAPQELWYIRSPKLADSFLIVALAATLFILANHHTFLGLPDHLTHLNLSRPAILSLAYWGLIALAWTMYEVLCHLQGFSTEENSARVRIMLGYALIPLILGGYLAVYVQMFLAGSWRLLPNFLDFIGIEQAPSRIELFSPQGEATLVHIIILGGLLSSLYAAYKVMYRIELGKVRFPHLVLPFLSIIALGFYFLKFI